MLDSQLPIPITFEWDTGNQSKSLEKHGITNKEAEGTFFRFKLIALDQRHSEAEARFGMYGQTDSGKILFIAFTVRGKRIRIISARAANHKERKFYEEEAKKIAKV